MEIRRMMSGAGAYVQGENAISRCGEELGMLRRGKAFIVGGSKAMAAAGDKLLKSLDEAAIAHTETVYSGFCTDNDINSLRTSAEKFGADCIIAVGGGKVMDVSKAAAALAQLPIFAVPTCASTCAAFAALSIVYNEKGCQDHTIYHKHEVNGVFVDTEVLSKTPARYLAAGMADAMAKSCEYSSMRKCIGYGDADISKYLGYRFALVSDEILLEIGEKAYRDNCAGTVSQELEDALFCTIAATGLISGMGGFAGRTGSRFAIAHGFNEVIRGQYVDTKTWLHGEIVAVGILAQLTANGADAGYVEKVRSFYNNIGVPTTLSAMGIDLDDNGFEQFTEKIIEHSHLSEKYYAQARAGINAVR